MGGIHKWEIHSNQEIKSSKEVLKEGRLRIQTSHLPIHSWEFGARQEAQRIGQDCK